MQTINQQNKETTSIGRSYFEFRLKHERLLDEFKRIQNTRKKELDKVLKTLDGISPLRIRNAITLVKKIIYKSPDELADDAFKLIIDGLERSFSRHYINSKDQIICYLNNTFKLQAELREHRNKKKKDFEKFKNNLKRQHYDVSLLNLAYNEYKRTIDYIKTQNITIEEYNKRVIEYDHLNDVIIEFIKIEYNNILNAKRVIENKKQEKINKERLYDEAIKTMFGIISKKEDRRLAEERLVTSILADMDIIGEL